MAAQLSQPGTYSSQTSRSWCADTTSSLLANLASLGLAQKGWGWGGILPLVSITCRVWGLSAVLCSLDGGEISHWSSLLCPLPPTWTPTSSSTMQRGKGKPLTKGPLPLSLALFWVWGGESLIKNHCTFVQLMEKKSQPLRSREIRQNAWVLQKEAWGPSGLPPGFFFFFFL